VTRQYNISFTVPTKWPIYCSKDLLATTNIIPTNLIILPALGTILSFCPSLCIKNDAARCRFTHRAGTEYIMFLFLLVQRHSQEGYTGTLTWGK
jgi:hypothetical protein